MNYISSTRPNKFDNLLINVPALYKKYPIGKNSFQNISGSQQEIGIFNRLYRLSIIPFSVANVLWYLFHRTNLDQRWFDEFKKYWRQVLGGLTLWGPQDFYFLRNIYRLKFQQTHLSKNNFPRAHLSSWQNPEVIYQLLDMAYRESLFNQVPALSLYFNYRKNNTDPIYEFGCGIAPVATTLRELTQEENLKIYLSDIQTIFFHYAAYKFRKDKQVVPLLLLPENKFLPKLPEKVGTIFCLTVFEHLTEPLAAAQKFYDLLLPAGILIFDYIKSEGKGMDTQTALKERGKVLHYISTNFKIVHGRFDDSNEAKTLVAVKP